MINFEVLSSFSSSLSPLRYFYFTNGIIFITSIFLTKNLQICKLIFSKTYVSIMSTLAPFIRQKDLELYQGLAYTTKYFTQFI